MPPQPSVTELRLNNVVNYLTLATSTLRDFSDLFSTPFLKTISNITLSLLQSVQNIKRNKDQCATLFEEIHAVMYGIIGLYVNFQGAVLPPTTVDHLGKFMQTLQKIHVYLEALQASSTVKRFFRQSESTTLFKECQEGLQQALGMFKVQTGAGVLSDVTTAEKNAHKIHRELLQLIEAYSEETASDHTCSIYDFSNVGNSSTSFSMLPSEPQIFNGRDSELHEIVQSLNQEFGRIAILGTGGIGKTSLARAVLHHPQITAKYSQRFFVPCDSAASSNDLSALVALHLGLKAEKNPTKSIIHFLSGTAPSLMILDNLETVWEPMESRSAVEEFLSLLTDVPHLGLIVTLRGAERPTKVQWSRPFLAPLKTLTDDATWQTFVDIADDVHEKKDILNLLALTGNLPLAVQIIAHLVDYEGCSQVFERWETEKISMFSTGHDKRSNLEVSIELSLSSPRVALYPDARDLLSLLSLLPDGLSETELSQSSLPLQDLPRCRAALLRTSLAYIEHGRLKALVPIREYMGKIHPPVPAVVHPLGQYFHSLLQLYRRYHGHQLAQVVDQITPNLGNLHSIILWGLNVENPNVRDTLHCAMALVGFQRAANRVRSIPISQLAPVVNQLGDSHMKALFITDLFLSWNTDPISNPQELIREAQDHFASINDVSAECKFYYAVGPYFSDHDQNVPKAMEFFHKALALSQLSGDSNQQCIVLNRLAMVNNMIGDHFKARNYSEQAQILARQSGNLWQESTAALINALACSALGHLKKSVNLCHRARECMSLCGLTGGDIDFRILRTEAEVYSLKSEYQEARAIYAHTIRETSQENSPLNYGYALLNIAAIDIVMGSNLQEAEATLDSAKSIFRALKQSHAMTLCDMILGDLKLRQGDMSTAKTILEQCFNLLRGYDIEGMLYCLEQLGDTSRWDTHNLSEMSGWTILFLGQSLKAKNKVAIHQALRCLGDVLLAQGDTLTAISLFNVALEAFTEMDIHLARGNCLIRLGDISHRDGNSQQAVEFWNRARPLFKLSSQAGCIQQIDERLAAVSQEDV
ncbi:ATPase-AAA-core domain-containing protein [Mycena venus]|uniref:ATPase-AAA-core domain-containing protein n=1 Tax=Mycena venus TaxID=2733690 RepID=A0A8H6YWF1_9AGAR|nr:ATPase-AAA-core domain-containing protein [Mycena venus]